MKFDDYRKLAPEQKEEYNWKFREKADFRFAPLLFPAGVAFLALMSMYLLIAYLGVTDARFAAYKLETLQLFRITFLIARAWMLVIVIDVLFVFAFDIFRAISERRWLKKIKAESNGLKQAAQHR